MRILLLSVVLALTGCSAEHFKRSMTLTDCQTQAPQVDAGERVTIELLALDLSSCGRCIATDANLDEAFRTVATVLREADVDVEVRKTIVADAAQAERLRFESSPTIRVNGRDIALELRESECEDCGGLCGCEGIDCRIWVWRGEEHTAAPKAMIVDAVLRAYGQPASTEPSTERPFELPENLRRFFDARAASASSAQSETPCCDRSTCCPPKR